jgi:hypothetical protein
LPSINALYEEFKGRGLALLLVNLGEDPQLVGKTAATRGYTAPVLLDRERTVSAAYLVTGTPTVYLVDRESRIVGRAIGRRDWAGAQGRRLMDALLTP